MIPGASKGDEKSITDPKTCVGKIAFARWNSETCKASIIVHGGI
jgi:hypothetical protein